MSRAEGGQRWRAHVEAYLVDTEGVHGWVQWNGIGGNGSQSCSVRILASWIRLPPRLSPVRLAVRLAVLISLERKILLFGCWCWLVLRGKYCCLIAGGWFILKEKYCCLVFDKSNEQSVLFRLASYSVIYPIILCLQICFKLLSPSPSIHKRIIFITLFTSTNLQI
jgi:hypothetical protein